MTVLTNWKHRQKGGSKIFCSHGFTCGVPKVEREFLSYWYRALADIPTRVQPGLAIRARLPLSHTYCIYISRIALHPTGDMEFPSLNLVEWYPELRDPSYRPYAALAKLAFSRVQQLLESRINTDRLRSYEIAI